MSNNLHPNINIPFNKPYFTGNETKYIKKAVKSGKISGNGYFTKKCHDFFNANFLFNHVLLTSSCTDALEMAAILLNLEPGDEVIVPSFTFVSTANPFILRGGKIVFADSGSDTPNINTDEIETLITPKTKAIVPIHYAGISCNMGKIMSIAKKHNLYVVEDAAQAIDSKHNDKYLGSLGDLSTFSFHETKNIISGEGGMLVINNEAFLKRAEIIWEKGTNRAQFYRGEINKYGWVDIGSSFLPSEITAAFLFAQLEKLDKIQTRRKKIWDLYYSDLKELENKGFIKLPFIPEYATNNAHMFYILCENINVRDELIAYLKKYGILSVFHYLPLHQSDYFRQKHDGRSLIHAERYSNTLLRLPLYYELSVKQISSICSLIKKFFLPG